MRIFASPKMRSIMQSLGMQRGEAIEHKMVTNAIEKAQKKVEGRNFDMRKQLLDYDDVANDQRTQVYAQRNELMDTTTYPIQDAIRRDVFTSVVANLSHQSLIEQWDIPGLTDEFSTQLASRCQSNCLMTTSRCMKRRCSRRSSTRRLDVMRKRLALSAKTPCVGLRSRFFRCLIINGRITWRRWITLSIHRAEAQKLKQEYKREAFELFTSMLDQIKRESVRVLTAVQVPTKEEIEAQEEARRQQAVEQLAKAQATHDAVTSKENGAPDAVPDKPMPAVSHKVGRNEPCPCGSGKKYKQCHGRIGYCAIAYSVVQRESQMKSSEGGLPVRGVRLGAVRAPVYENKDRDDLLLMAFDEGSVGACVTTANQFCAAPLHLLRAHLASTAHVRYWLLNAGNANAGTGGPGMDVVKPSLR